MKFMFTLEIFNSTVKMYISMFLFDQLLTALLSYSEKNFKQKVSSRVNEKEIKGS